MFLLPVRMCAGFRGDCGVAGDEAIRKGGLLRHAPGQLRRRQFQDRGGGQWGDVHPEGAAQFRSAPGHRVDLIVGPSLVAQLFTKYSA